MSSGHEVCRCVTQPDRPQGRGLTRRPSPVKSAAARLRLPVDEPERLGDYLPELQRLRPDLGVVVSYGKLVPGPLLRLPRLGMVGIHPSLLPRYRGANPIAMAILNGEMATGVSIFMLAEALDAGEVVVQRRVAIGPEETAEELTARLAGLSRDALLEAAGALESGAAQPAPQDERAATYARKFSKEDGRIDWRQSAASIHRLIRATSPWPGAFTGWRGQPLKICAAGADSLSGGEPGAVIAASASEGLIVGTGEGRLLIRELQPAGKRRMSVGEFLAGHQLRIGERLGVTSDTREKELRGDT